jgi:mannose-binding lectin 1
MAAQYVHFLLICYSSRSHYLQPGVIRGFLNDGRTDYKNHHSVDSLAFGHCGYAYRNLGRPSQLKIRQTSSLFKVEIDGDICFESANIKIPEGYFLGISAVSADIPDSYEVFRMVTMTDKNEPGQSVTNIETNQQALVQQMEQLNKPKGEYVPEFLGKDNEDPPEISADQIKSDRQFADLHDRLQATFKHVSSFQRDFDHFTAEGMIRNNELLGILGGAMEQMKSMEERLKAMEKNIETIKYQVGDKDYLRLHTELKQAMQDSHSNILAGVGQSVKNHAPSMGWFLFLVLGFQGVLAVSYVAYKRQRANSPKKYL